MQISKKGLGLLKDWEGVILHIYRDSAGKATIGIGHLIRKGEDFSKGLTLDQALSLLEKDIQPAVDDVNLHVKHTLTQDQFDALVIFTFNIGTHGFDTSSALTDINNNNLDKVPTDLLKWNKITDPKTGLHKIDNGLVNRRKNEIKLWKGLI